jgi:hypothetical protein
MKCWINDVKEKIDIMAIRIENKSLGVMNMYHSNWNRMPERLNNFLFVSYFIMCV